MVLPPLTSCALLERAYANAPDILLLAVSLADPSTEGACRRPCEQREAAIDGRDRRPSQAAPPAGFRVLWTNSAARRFLGAGGAPDFSALVAAEPALAERLATCNETGSYDAAAAASAPLPLRTARLLAKFTPCTLMLESPVHRAPGNSAAATAGGGGGGGGGGQRAPPPTLPAALRRAAGFLSSCFRPPPTTQQGSGSDSGAGVGDSALTVAAVLLQLSPLELISGSSLLNDAAAATTAADGAAAAAASSSPSSGERLVGGVTNASAASNADIVLASPQGSRCRTSAADAASSGGGGGAGRHALQEAYDGSLGESMQLQAHVSVPSPNLPPEVGGWVLAGLPLCVSVFAADGRMMVQNAASVDYFGGRVATHAGADVLTQLFALDGNKLKAMLAHTLGGGDGANTAVWEGIVKVPASMASEVAPGQQAVPECADVPPAAARKAAEIVTSSDVGLLLRGTATRSSPSNRESSVHVDVLEIRQSRVNVEGGVVRTPSVGAPAAGVRQQPRRSFSVTAVKHVSTLQRELDDAAAGKQGAAARKLPALLYASSPTVLGRASQASVYNSAAGSGGGGRSAVGSPDKKPKTSLARFCTTQALATSTWQVLLDSHDAAGLSSPSGTASACRAPVVPSSSRGSSCFPQPPTAPAAAWSNNAAGGGDDMCAPAACTNPDSAGAPSFIFALESIKSNDSEKHTDILKPLEVFRSKPRLQVESVQQPPPSLSPEVVGPGARHMSGGVVRRTASMQCLGRQSSAALAQDGSVPRVLTFASSVRSVRGSCQQSRDGLPGASSACSARNCSAWDVDVPSTVAPIEGGGQPVHSAAEDAARAFPPHQGNAVPAGGVPYTWHEVRASSALDPATGERYLLIIQKDVTPKVEAERHIAQVSEAEHRLLESIFPRHVLQYMSEQPVLSPPSVAAPVGAAVLDDAAASVYDSAPAHGACTSPATWRPYVQDCSRLATWHKKVTILFCDIEGFTPMCGCVSPGAVMAFLNDLFVQFDAQLDVHGVYKVETIGDCYVVAGGLIREDQDGMAAVWDGDEVDERQADKVFAFAKVMLRTAARVALPTTPSQPCRVRIGIHTGPAMSGVVGTRQPRFCVFGDTMNTASRMESSGVPGSIHASEATYELLRGYPGWAPTGGIEVKGKGRMNTYLWTPAT